MAAIRTGRIFFADHHPGKGIDVIPVAPAGRLKADLVIIQSVAGPHIRAEGTHLLLRQRRRFQGRPLCRVRANIAHLALPLGAATEKQQQHDHAQEFVSPHNAPLSVAGYSLLRQHEIYMKFGKKF